MARPSSHPGDPRSVARPNSPPLPPCRVRGHEPLDEVDLTPHLGKKEAKAQLAAAQERLVHLRLLLGGQIGPADSARRCSCCSRAGTPRARAGPSSAWSSELDPRHVAGRPVRRPHLRREAAPLPVAVLAGAPGLGRHGRARPHLVRPGAGRAGRGLRLRGDLAPGLRRDRRPGDDAGRRGHDPGQVLDARLAGGAAAPLRGPPATTPTGRGSSPTRTGATARSGPSTRPPSRRCWSAPTTPPRPWHVVAADDKRWARVDVVRTVCEAIEDGTGRPAASTPTLPLTR